MKRVFVFLIIAFLALFAYKVNAQNDTNTVVNHEVSNYWGSLKTNFLNLANLTNDKLDIIRGFKNIEGKDIVLWNGWLSSGKIWTDLAFAVLVTLWIFLFSIFTKKISNSARLWTWMKFFGYLLIVFLVLFILPAFPLLNRIMQIITLEFLGVNILFRSLIWGTAISFSRLIYIYLRKYLRRKKVYEDELKKAAGEETLRAISKG